MADAAHKLPDNVAGRYFVDRTCIDCDLCRETAPNNFTRNDAEGYSFVFQQPRDEAEERACGLAMDECPVEAIGLVENPGDE
jgi:ferredoxin